MSFWGRHFPRLHWGGYARHFPGDGAVGLAPAGSATFALLENATVTYAWRTGLFKSYSGLERRSNIVDDPAHRYEGSAVLVGNNTRATRSRLAKFAALGRPFLLGLSYEQLTIRAAAVGSTVYVYSTARSDWAIPGGRVIVRHKTHGDAERVIVSVGADSLVLDSAPGSCGNLGAVVMPAMAVYLDPTQGFNRYPTTAERWQIRVRNAIAGFASPEARASLAVPGLTGVTIYARLIGSDANDITVTFAEDGSTLGNIVEDTVLRTIVVHYDPASTPLGRLATMFATSTLAYIEGASGITAIGYASAFGPTALAGGADYTHAEVGRGAVVNEFAGRPLWDRGIDVEGTAPDSMQSMAQHEDLGGLPFNAGMASVPDWGRALQMTRPISLGTASEFQWLKRFLDTIKGRWRTFWLATWRADLVPVSTAAGTLTITAGENAGDFFAWWPTQEYLQIQQTDGTLTYVRVSAAAQVGSAIALTIVDGADAPVTLSATAIRMVSWLDRVRLESDEVAIQFTGWTFKVSTVARVVRQPDEGASQDEFLENEISVELSQPREGIEIRLTSGAIPVVYRIATGTRDIEIDGQLFRATAGARGQVTASTFNAEGALEVTLPVAHPLAQRYMAGGVPPRQLVVKVYRHQLESGTTEKIHEGEATSIAIGGHVARLLVPSRLSEAAMRQLPTIGVGRSCLNVLYDDTCRVDRDSFKITGTVAGINGRIVTVDVAMDDQWATFGEFLHVATGERMAVQEQTSTIDLDGPHAHITMQSPILEMIVGDAVEVYAGCTHLRAMCLNLFDNIVNYAGFPDMPTKNPFSPNGIGLYQTE